MKTLALAVCVPFATLAQGARLQGTVVDSVGRRALAGAQVQLVDASNPSRGWASTADTAGGFAFLGLSAGRYVIGFLHPMLDSLGLEATSRPLVLAEGDVQTIDLAIPSPRSLVAALCKADVTRDSTGLLIGRVRHASGSLGDGGLQASWSELQFTREGLRRSTPSQRTKTGTDGWFAMCGLPLRSPLAIRAWQGADSTGFLEFDLPATGLLRRDLVVGRAVTTVATETTPTLVDRGNGLPPTMRHDTVSVTRTSRGPGSIRGAVRTITGAPIEAARVELWGTNVRSTTNSEGVFALDSVPEGSQTLVVRGIGFVPYRAVVDVLPPATTLHDVSLAPFVAAMDTVRILGARSLEIWKAGFDARRTKGFGEFLDEKQINARNPMQVSDLFRDLPGVSILSSGAFGRKVVMRSRAGGLFCIPAVFVDGVRFFNGAGRGGRASTPGPVTVTGNADGVDLMEYTGTADLEFVVNPTDIKAIEVYAHDSSIPVEFDDPRDGCGSIVIWTGARRGR